MLLDKVPLMNPDYSRPANNLRGGLAVEFSLFFQPKVFLITLAVVLIPALCLWIYIGSTERAQSHPVRLPAAFVNQDVPAVQAGRRLDLGAGVAEIIAREKSFAFAPYDTPEAARAAVRSGKVFLALLLPPDFSKRSLAGEKPAQLSLYVSEGGNYAASQSGRRFGTALAYELNDRLNRERWATWVAAGESDGAPKLGEGLAAIQAGAKRLVGRSEKIHDDSRQLHAALTRTARSAETLADTSAKVADGSTRLGLGIRQASSSLSDLVAKLPENNRLAELDPLVETLSRDAADLRQSLEKLQPGVMQLDNGTGQLQASTARVLFIGGRLSAGAAQVRSGVSALGESIDQAAVKAGHLNEGIDRFRAAVQPIAVGFGDFDAGLRAFGAKLPTAAQFDSFNDATGRLRDGGKSLAAGLGGLNRNAAQLDLNAAGFEQEASELSAGLAEAASRFQNRFAGNQPGQFAAPVEAVVEVGAPVPQGGAALAPCFAALSLWLGAILTGFVFHVRRLPGSMRRASRPSRWLAKALPLLVLGAMQATAMVAVFKWMDIGVANPSATWAVAVIGSLAFVSVNLLLLQVLGDFGRLLAVVLLIVQFAASGGIFPVEFSSSLYQTLHDWLPVTFLVQSFRGTIFAAFGGEWHSPARVLGIFAAAAMLGGILLARWKYVAREAYGSAVEV